MNKGKPLIDAIFDAIADGRNSIRVAYNKDAAPENGASFYVSFLVNVDADTHKLLGTVAKKKEYSVPSLMRRYVKACFQMCILADDEDVEPELKEAA
jgi:hypothetical protein